MYSGRAIDSKKNYTITFKSEAHKIFYLKYLPECRYQDVYHKALVYCLGIECRHKKSCE